MREKITVTPEFKETVAAYQKRHGFKSWAQALLHLAAVGYRAETQQELPPTPQWGGTRIEAIMEQADLLTDYGRNDPTEHE